MARIVLKQPNGLYAIWSTVVDAFIMLDCDKKDILKHHMKQAKEEVKDRVARDLADADKGNVFREGNDWESRVKWLWYVHVQHGDSLDEWKYINENIDDTAAEKVKSIVQNEKGEWISG